MTPYWQRRGWRWAPGAVSRAGGSHTGPLRVESVSKDGTPDLWTYRDAHGCLHLQRASGTPGWAADVWNDAQPDLDDGPTRGAALDVLRAVTGDPGVHAAPVRDGWEVCGSWHRENGIGRCIIHGEGLTEAAALLAALDKAIPL